MSKLGCSSRIGIPLLVIVIGLFFIAFASGPIGQSKLGKILPYKYMPDKPLSGVKVQELEVNAIFPSGLTEVSYDEFVRLGKNKNVNVVTIAEDEESLAVSLKLKDTKAKNVVVNTAAGATITVDPKVQDVLLGLKLSEPVTEEEFIEELRGEGVKVKESSPLAPEKLIHVSGDFYITNTLLATWLTMLVLILLAYFATRKMKEIPHGVQNIMEAVIEIMVGFVEGVAGKENGRKFFFIVGSIFLFVVTNAWLGLFPFFNAVTYNGVGMFRGANTDINVPLCIALVSFVMVEYWGISSIGFRVYMGKFIRVDNLRQGKIVTGLVDLFVGALETLSEFIRIISFTFRLFGNMTAGEILLLVTAFLIPFVFSTIFYGLELFIGLVQGLIFAGLTLVFATTAVAGHGEEGHSEEKHHE